MKSARLGLFLTLGAGTIVALALTVSRNMCHLHDARQTKAKADIKAIVYALETFRIERGALPTTAQGLEALVNRDSDAYLSKVPTDPWGTSYTYVSHGHTYSVISLGADGAVGGEGDDADVEGSSAFGDTRN